jgi:hypothetical protein
MIKRLWLGFVYLNLVLSLTACIFSSESQQVREVTENFWQAILDNQPQTAEAYITNSSKPFLPLLNNQKIAAKRFESGEIQIKESVAEVAIVLYRGDKADMPIPLRTLLLKTEQGWQIDVQKTMGSMVNGAMDVVVKQLDELMAKGLTDSDANMRQQLKQLQGELQTNFNNLQHDMKTKP